MKKNLLKIVVTSALPALALVSCSVGPDYKKPDLSAVTPADWRWKTAEPRDAQPKGDWWKIFNDPVLDELEAAALANNQDLRAAVARVDQGRSVARIARSQFFPELTLDPAYKRERTSGNPPTPIPFPIPSAQLNTYTVPLDLSYELDVWGRVRRSFESARAKAQADVADFHNVMLTLSADVAANYFLARSLDAQIAAWRRTIEVQEKGVQVLSERFANGSAAEIALAQAKTELAKSKVDMADVCRQRAETVNALALLCGQPASTFTLQEQPFNGQPPEVPVDLPSSVLERRPDIARAERNMASKNAQIGVAQAAYFPSIRLVGQGGYLSAEADTLFSQDSRIWSFGPAISLPIFNAGRTSSQVRQSKAAYQEAQAQYYNAVLTAFKEVEDSLAQIVMRKQQVDAQTQAFESARRASELTLARYQAGVVSQQETLDAQRNELIQERKKAEYEGQSYVARIRLIKALGGGWSKADTRSSK